VVEIVVGPITKQQFPVRRRFLGDRTNRAFTRLSDDPGKKDFEFCKQFDFLAALYEKWTLF
jgi:hypothetical protein